MAEGNSAAAAGDYAGALAAFDSVVRQFPDFATTEYARLSRALMLYQEGRVSDAILQLEDLEVALRGYSEVHAALAAILYAERPVRLQQAEQQWEIAMEFNPRFADRQWVADTKHWPPRLLAALDRFLSLQ
jgi:tetratricopeptide (TPR) repeat protein